MGAEETVFHKIDKNISTKFTGYDRTEDTGIISFLANDDDLIESAKAGETVYIVPDKTCFYAESGGQAGDTGVVETETGKAEVLDTQKAVGGKFALKVNVTEGELTKGQQVTFKVDKAKRLATMRNHSCAHLLQAALRTVLGDHVHQAGQLVDSQRLRFDFSHFEAMTADEKAQVEALVNKFIFDALDITMEEMPIAEAQKLGAMALFGEKYGETVRVVTMGDKADAASIEFCGGTHLNNTSKIGLFKIIAENSVASGVRRIEAVTGTGVLELLNSNIDTINKAAETLKLNNPAELVSRCGAVMQEIKGLEKERDSLETAMANMRAKSVLENAVEVNGVSVACAQLTNVKPDVLRKMADELKASNDKAVVIMTTVNGDKGNIVAACGKEAVAKGAHAGKIAGKIAALTNGKGGGRPDSAMAGVGDISLIAAALDKAAEVVGEFVK